MADATADQIAHPTPYPGVNAVLRRLRLDVQTVLGHHLIGLVVHGSLASGDFDPQRSDIDFVVVTADKLAARLTAALAAMHARIWASGLPWATRLEGDYIPQRALRRYDPAHARYPHLGVDGHFDVEQHASDGVIQRHVIREHGLVLSGPAPRTLIDPVEPDDLRHATLGILREWWSPMLHDHTRLLSREYQAYAVLTMCRALYTLEQGAIVSKPIAAHWAQSALGGRWGEAIEQALVWPMEPQPDDLDATLDLVRYTLKRGQAVEALPHEQV
jgi:hypothetical protein